MLTLAPHTFPTQQDLQKMLGFSVGFDGLFNRLNTMDIAQSGYPPYNIEQTSKHSYRITLAVAGFSEADLSVNVEDRQLVVRGSQAEDELDRVFLHRGIGARQFQRVFILAEGVEVGKAIMENGLLHLDLTQAVPDSIVKNIPIKKRYEYAK